MNFKLAIIVAAYNAESFIDECICSFLNNSNNEEAILVVVNDGSKDNTLDKIKNYQHIDNIVVLSKENGGLSSARNYGIDYVRNKCTHISFLDSDDYIANDYIDSFISIVNDVKNIDIIEFNLTRFGVLSDKEINISLNIDKSVEIDEFLLSKIYDKGLWFAVSRIYSIRLFDELYFPYGKHYEDVILIPQLYYKAKTLFSLNKSLYFYRDNPDGITRNASLNNVKDIISAVDFLCEYNVSENLSLNFKKSTYNTVIYVLVRVDMLLPPRFIVNDISRKFNVNLLFLYGRYLLDKTKYVVRCNIKKVLYGA